VAIFISCSFIFIRYYVHINELNKIPIFEYINLYFVFCYIGVFFFEKNSIFNEYSIANYEFAISIFFYGYFIFIFGYFLTSNLITFIEKKEINYLNCTNHEIFLTGFIVLSYNIIFYIIFNISNLIPGLDQLRFPTQLLGTGLLLKYLTIYKYDKNFVKLKVLLSVFLIILIILLEFISGSYTLPFINILLLTIFYFYLKNKVNFTILILFLLIFTFLHIGKHEFRKKTWNENLNPSRIEKLKVFFMTYKNIINEDKSISNILKRDDIKLQRRIFHSMESLIVVTSQSPEYIPFWNGYSYKILKSKLIPRIFWKDKPSDKLGNEFGHRYNILNKFENNYDKQTSWNMPVLNEFYVNYGIKGVIIGMLLLGAIISIITNFFKYKNKLNIESTLSFFILMPIFFLESHLSLLIGNLLQIYLIIFISIFFLLFIIRKTNFK
tara:strand:- start:1169 stop:2482 length:1314 start_codon:yes stop_codon:yes gene_type:complete